MLTHRELRSVIVIGNPKWRVGVLGIVAGNICEEYGRPAFVWGREGEGNIKGSCRSDGSVNVVELMASVRKKLFINVGGHELAGGFSIAHDNIHTLEDELALAYGKVKRANTAPEKLPIDANLSLDEVTWNTYGEIERLAPFGIGNHKPTFLFENIKIENMRHFGKEKNHLGLDFKNSGGRGVSAIGFFMDKDFFPGVSVAEDERITLVATLEKSFFGGGASCDCGSLKYETFDPVSCFWRCVKYCAVRLPAITPVYWSNGGEMQRARRQWVNTAMLWKLRGDYTQSV